MHLMYLMHFLPTGSQNKPVNSVQV